jgi:selenide,water dikinase
VLRPLQSLFDSTESPNLLVGLGSPDDAAVWRLDDSRALVVTTDFFTPIVDDPYAYGAIAAANALSDLYAMGATPFLALNLVAMPSDLEPEIVAEILRGGAEQIRRAGAVLAGGHSIQDSEPKYGLVALGMADPARLMTKDAARPGDRLALTKPLGTGVTTTALIRDQGEPRHAAEAIEWMSRLNDQASRLALQAGVRAATDVTGFGLLGHGLELAQASGVGLRIHGPSVPFFSGARRYAELGTFPGGSMDNLSYFGPRVTFDPALDEPARMLLFDAQTSGGLLLCLPPNAWEGFRTAADEAGLETWAIGEVVEGEGIQVVEGAYRPG